MNKHLSVYKKKKLHLKKFLPISILNYLISATDTSLYGISAAFSYVILDNIVKPIGFVSRTLTNAEKSYRQVNKEALDIIFGVNNFFFQYLYSNRFILFTDSKPLASIFSPSKNIPVLSAARIRRYVIYLQPFQYRYPL